MTKMRLNKLHLMISLRHPRQRNNAKSDSIVLIRLDRIGDFVMSYSVFQEYRQYYTNRRIILICNSACLQIAELFGVFDEIIPIDLDRFKFDIGYQKRISKEIKSIRCQIAIQMVCNRNIYMEYISSIVRARMKYALSGEIKPRALLFDLIVYSSVVKLDDYFCFDIRKNFLLFNHVTGRNIKSYQGQIDNNSNSRLGFDYVILAIGGSFNAKKLEIKKYAEAINYLIRNTKYRFILLGGLEDEDQLNEFWNEIIDSERCISCVGKTTIIDCFNYISGAKFIISNDTSFVHIAVLYNIPSIVVAGDYDRNRFLPYDLEEYDDSRNYPEVIKHEMDCGGCKISYGKCRALIESFDKRFECISGIDSSELIEKIRVLIRDGKI